MIERFFYPMRIFFLLSSVFGVLAGFVFFSDFDFISIHKIIFLEFLTISAYIGFLLTALPDWTNYQGSLKWHTVFLLTSLILAFLAIPFSIEFTNLIIFVIWFYIFIFSSYMIFIAKDDNNFSVLLVLFSLTLLSFFYAFTNDSSFLDMQIFIHCIMVLIISFRISVVLGAEALRMDKEYESDFLPNGIYKNIALTCIYAFVIAFFIQESQQTLGFISLACGSAILAKLKELHYIVLLKRHFVLFYYLLQVLMAIAFIWLGFDYIFSFNEHSRALHLLSITSVLLAIYFVFNVASIRHSGFKVLNIFMVSRIGLAFLILSAISRSFLANFGDVFYIYLPATLVILAFSIYFFKFFIVFKNNDFSDDPE